MENAPFAIDKIIEDNILSMENMVRMILRCTTKWVKVELSKLVLCQGEWSLSQGELLLDQDKSQPILGKSYWIKVSYDPIKPSNY